MTQECEAESLEKGAGVRVKVAHVHLLPLIFFHLPVSIIQGSKVQMVSFRFTNLFTSSEKHSRDSCKLALGN